eukprot:GHVT01047621.1.p1 GENE.GHVT01047621.1~~GHVT01047621.1.p1  ORF type:complete len:153 (+),score=22.36 GHVT01047621.1:2216-2674(+)
MSTNLKVLDNLALCETPSVYHFFFSIVFASGCSLFSRFRNLVQLFSLLLLQEYEKFALELQSFSQFSTSTIQKTVQIGTECLGILGTVFEGQTIVAALSSKDSAEIAVIPSGQVVESSHGGNEVQVSEEGWTAFVQKHNQVLQEFHPAMVEE